MSRRPGLSLPPPGRSRRSPSINAWSHRMLDADLKTQLKAYLEKVTQPIELVASLDDGPLHNGEKSRELEGLLQDIAALSDKISYSRRDDDARRPSFAINRT